MARNAVTIRPRGPLDAVVRVPGSKSLTNRALLVAGLAGGDSQLQGALASDDTEAMRDCLAALGIPIESGSETWTIRGCGGVLSAPRTTLDARASGTTARFVTALATLAPGPVTIDGTHRMRERPIDDLTRALQELGAEIELLGRGGCPPVRVAGGGLRGGSAVIDASRSSQFVTAVLLAAPYAARDVRLSLKDGVLASRPYVELTLQLMRAFGAEAGWQDERTLVVGGRPYRARAYAIEPDASSAVYPLAAAAIAGGRVRVPGIPRSSLQADLGLLEVLERMGCRVVRSGDSIELHGPGASGLRGVDVDMNATPDAVVALAVVALFAQGPSVIRNVVQLRDHETDRLAALESELTKLGARVRAGPDSLRIEPGPLRGAEISTYDDHRIAMSFALAGLRVPDVTILEPDCVSKTWPDFFAALERL